ncbi:hypothetical protein Patl1_19393 [Pistacia atlantica]|uniref:Uncharacterized protein n=1 Tax=Pistacia atlantica TaxID=434234 RepID=A0ACC1BY26_9ROSI|nr:hypothetical protein Patl1_19393 [Pistacia atlantica]
MSAHKTSHVRVTDGLDKMTESALCLYSPDMLVSAYKKRFGKWDYHSTIQGGGFGESMVTSSLCSPKEHLSGWDLLPMLNHGAANTKNFSFMALLGYDHNNYHVFLEQCSNTRRSIMFWNPVSEYNSGPTMIKLSEPGTRFFISGGDGSRADGVVEAGEESKG